MKKTLALILAILMLSSCLFSCDEDFFFDDESGDFTSDTGVEQTDKQTESEKPTEKPTEIPTQDSSQTDGTKITVAIPAGPDFDGETLTILHRDSISAQREWYKETAEDSLDEVIGWKNDCITEILDLKIQYKACGSSYYEDCLNEFTKAIKADVDNDSHLYDIVANYAYAGASVHVRDYIANLADKEIFPYFDFKHSSWNQSIVNECLINDQLYYITGDINLSTFDKSMVVFFNKSLYDKKKEPSDPADLQELAIAGDGAKGGFTYDVLYRWATVFEETNGDTGIQHDDFHAISAPYTSVSIDALPHAWDLSFITTNRSFGTHSYDIAGNSKIEAAITKAQNLLNGKISKGVCNDDNTEECSLGGYTESITHLVYDKSIFAFHILYNNQTDNEMMREEMISEFGLLPMPKYDENQLNYGTTAHDSYTLMTVIDHSLSSIPTKGEEISAYLQMSTEESRINVRGYYIHTIVKPKYFGLNTDIEKSVTIANIIMDNIELPFFSV